MTRSSLTRFLLRALQQARSANLIEQGRSAPRRRGQPGWTRRRFLKAGALAGALPLTMRTAWATHPDRPAPRVAIVGGGIAGLNAAHQLNKRGIAATVYEARRRIGGRIHSVTGAIGPGLVTDLGAELINSDHEDMLGLAREFHVELFNRADDAAGFPFPRTGYFFDGFGHAEPLVAEDLRALAGQIAFDSERLDSDWETVAPELDALSVRDYLDLHAGLIPAAYIRTLIECGIRTEYGVEPEESSALQLIFNLPTVDGVAVEVLGNSDEIFTVQGGTERIIEGLARALAGQVRTDMPLTRIGAMHDEFLLTFRSGETVTADFVIVTIPFPALRDVRLDVDLPRSLREFIDTAGLGRNEKLIAGFAERAWRQSRGFVGEAWTDLGFSEVWDETQRQTDRTDGALTFFLGGDEVDALDAGSASTVGEGFVHALDGILPGVEAAATGRYLRTRWHHSRYTRGAYANYRPGQLTRFGGHLWIESPDPAERQSVHAGNLLFAGEHLSDAYYGFMNGAAQTGRLAARWVARRVAGRPGEAAI